MKIRPGDPPLTRRWKELKMTADEVAEEVGVHRSFVYDVARGVKRPSLKTAAKFSRVLRKPVQELFPDIFLPSDSTDSGTEVRTSHHSSQATNTA